MQSLNLEVILHTFRAGATCELQALKGERIEPEAIEKELKSEWDSDSNSNSNSDLHSDFDFDFDSE